MAYGSSSNTMLKLNIGKKARYQRAIENTGGPTRLAAEGLSVRDTDIEPVSRVGLFFLLDKYKRIPVLTP